jgi:site-specific recombinase XerD
MDRGRVSGIAPRNHRYWKGGRKAPRRPPGLAVVERDGHWHIRGTLRVAGNSRLIRKSTELSATPENREYAEALRAAIERETRDEVVHGVRPSIATAIACDQYLGRRRSRPVGHRESAAVQEIEAKFGPRKLNTISDEEWQAFVDDRQRNNSLSSRERYITAVHAFLNWCRKKSRRWITEMPEFERDKKAARPPKRRARRVNDLTPELIMLMLEHAAPHLAAQLAVEWCTGAWVSSVLYGCRLCDVILVPGRGQITFHDTKNGEPVVAALKDWAVERLIDYLEVRGGRLDDREQPFFLTDEGLPYTDNGKTSGGQNKSAFNGMKRRTVKTIRRRGAADARAHRRAGDRKAAWAAIATAKDQAALVASVTQHWFRHKLATALRRDLQAAMEQGGWRDVDSVMGYIHDVPVERRRLIDDLPIGGSTNNGIAQQRTRGV